MVTSTQTIPLRQTPKLKIQTIYSDPICPSTIPNDQSFLKPNDKKIPGHWAVDRTHDLPNRLAVDHAPDNQTRSCKPYQNVDSQKETVRSRAVKLHCLKSWDKNTRSMTYNILWSTVLPKQIQRPTYPHSFGSGRDTGAHVGPRAKGAGPGRGVEWSDVRRPGWWASTTEWDLRGVGSQEFACGEFTKIFLSGKGEYYNHQFPNPHLN